MSVLPERFPSILRALPRALAPGALALVAACGGGSDGDGIGFIVTPTSHAVDASSEVVLGGFLLVYFADEGTSGSGGNPSTDLNGDTDTLDDVAVVVNALNGVTTVLQAALDAAIVGNQVYLVVSEAQDGVDWSGDDGGGPFDDIVLLCWDSTDTNPPVFVDVLDPAAGAVNPVLAVGGALFYPAAAVPVGADDTSLMRIDSTAPTTPVPVPNEAGAGQLRPRILGEAEGILFLGLDETDGPSPPPGSGGPLAGPPDDYNGDGDMTDLVLALLDGTDPAANAKSTGLAVADANVPFDARYDFFDDDWLVAFLVNEADQNATNFNDETLPEFTQPLTPDHCQGPFDTDTLDDVLFFLEFNDFIAGLATPINTGFAGADRVVVAADYVGTISPEADATCDLNLDGVSDDRVARWVQAVQPMTPVRDSAEMYALFDVPGGSHGLSVLSDRLVIVADEAADDAAAPGGIDGKAGDHTLVGHLDPTDGLLATWTFSHPATNPGTGIAGEPFVGTSWMAAEESEGRLGMTYMEEVPAIELNVDLFCDQVSKEAGAADATDALPLWTDFAGTTMDFDGQGYAVLPGDPGIVLVRGFAFYRVSETQDAFDYNNDGDTSDMILFRNPQAFCATVAMGTERIPPGGGTTPVIFTDGFNTGAFLSSELPGSGAGIDFNGDGDMNDVVVRYFLIQ